MDHLTYLSTFSSLLGADSSKTEVKKYGEVYTPLSLVEEMLDELPLDIWSDPSQQWLEPAAGLAPFLFCAYRRLMTGLQEVISNPLEREKHILETMFTFQELQPKNVSLLRTLFSPHTLRILEGDYLLTSLPQKYNVVVGNPPYQKNGSSGTGNTIWDLFVRKVLDKDLAEKGYLLFIHPPLWRKPSSLKSKNAGLFELMAHDHYIKRLVMCDAKKGKATFGCLTRYDWYCLQQGGKGITSLRTCKGEEYKVNLQEWEWLPNGRLEEIRSLLGEEKCIVVYDRSAYGTDKAWTKEKEDTAHPYPIIRTTNKSGVRWMYSSCNGKGHFGVGKVVFGDGGIISNVVVDVEGKYGLSEHAIGIAVDDEREGEEVCKALLSPFFLELLQECTWSTRQLDWRLFACFRKDWYRMVNTPSS